MGGLFGRTFANHGIDETNIWDSDFFIWARHAVINLDLDRKRWHEVKMLWDNWGWGLEKKVGDLDLGGKRNVDLTRSTELLILIVFHGLLNVYRGALVFPKVNKLKKSSLHTYTDPNQVHCDYFLAQSLALTSPFLEAAVWLCLKSLRLRIVYHMFWSQGY